MSETKTAEDILQDEEAMQDAQKELGYQKTAKQAFESIWKKFGKNRKKGRTTAYAELLQDLTANAAKLVPHYMTAKEFVSIISEIESHTKGDGGANQGDPLEVTSKWLRGEIEMSRIPLEKLQ